MQQFGGKDSKRHFTVVMGGKEHGLYVSSTPSSAAKKVVTKLCAANKKKKVEFYIREITQGSKKKTYGPYVGHIEKLKEPIELEGRVIKYKSVAKLSGKSGAKKGGASFFNKKVSEFNKNNEGNPTLEAKQKMLENFKVENQENPDEYHYKTRIDSKKPNAFYFGKDNLLQINNQKYYPFSFLIIDNVPTLRIIILKSDNSSTNELSKLLRVSNSELIRGLTEFKDYLTKYEIDNENIDYILVVKNLDNFIEHLINLIKSINQRTDPKIDDYKYIGDYTNHKNKIEKINYYRNYFLMIDKFIEILLKITPKEYKVILQKINDYIKQNHSWIYKIKISMEGYTEDYHKEHQKTTALKEIKKVLSEEYLEKVFISVFIGLFSIKLEKNNNNNQLNNKSKLNNNNQLNNKNKLKNNKVLLDSKEVQKLLNEVLNYENKLKNNDNLLNVKLLNQELLNDEDFFDVVYQNIENKIKRFIYQNNQKIYNFIYNKRLEKPQITDNQLIKDLLFSEDIKNHLKYLIEKIEELKKSYVLEKIQKEISNNFLVKKIIEALKKLFSNESNKNPLNNTTVYNKIFNIITKFIYDKRIYFFIINEKLNNPQINKNELIQKLLNIKDVQELLKNLKEITIPNITST
jgi:hypothetical protein